MNKNQGRMFWMTENKPKDANNPKPLPPTPGAPAKDKNLVGDLKKSENQGETHPLPSKPDR